MSEDLPTPPKKPIPPTPPKRPVPPALPQSLSSDDEHKTATQEIQQASVSCIGVDATVDASRMDGVKIAKPTSTAPKPTLKKTAPQRPALAQGKRKKTTAPRGKKGTQDSISGKEVAKTTWLKPSLYGGRFTRKQYFWRMLLVGIIAGILGGILQQILVTPPHLVEVMRSARALEKYQQELIQVGLITNIPVMIFFYLPFGIKRAHDIGHKGTFLITLMVITLIVQLLGCVSMEIYTILSMIMLIPALIYGCILLFKDSQKGTNAYGPSTKYPDTVA